MVRKNKVSLGNKNPNMKLLWVIILIFVNPVGHIILIIAKG